MPADKPPLATLLWVVALSPPVQLTARRRVPLSIPCSCRLSRGDTTRRRSPDDQMVNSLYAAYCPRIGGNAALSETEKYDRATAFLSEAERVTFGGGGD